ncbi:MAG: TrkH family potassium uptake protein [Proteobacteria bacterium]|nr:TrkH family potassium uptake protein [Pseudomonadota bacterium]
MLDFRPVFLVVGILLTTLAVGMIIPAVVDAAAGHPEWQVFAASAGVTMFVGVSMALTSRAGGISFTVRQAFLMTTLSWLAITVFAALPFAFSALDLSFTDAFFEAMSGITTTGSTVITGLDSAPPGILLWRALLQWLGGIGIIVMAIAVMPMLRVGGMQLFRVEASEQSEKVMPRAAQIASAIGVIYLGLTVLWAGAYWMAGMSGFEAIVHSMTTIATGGFSTSDASLGHFASVSIDAIATAGMLVGGLPFLLYLRTVQGDFRVLFRDTQVRSFITIVAVVVVASAAWLWLDNGFDPLQALRYSAFNVASVITGTGYSTSDYGLWGSFAVPIFFFLMFIGGCAGSTTCGIKVFRFQVLYAAARTQIRHLLQPHGVFIPYYNRRPIPDDVIISVLSFFFVFGLSFALLAMGLGILGLDFLTAVSSAATAISNVGPGLGPVVGPAGTFQSLPDAAKWLLAAGMLLGRLELFTVIVLFTRSFWRG